MPTNVLSADDATFDTSIGNWTGTSISRVTTPTPHAGSGVLAIANSDLAATLPLGVTPSIPNGHIVTVSAWMRQSSPGTMSFAISSTSTSKIGNYFATFDVVPTASWQQQGAAYLILGSGADTVEVDVIRNSAPVPGTIGYLSDVFVGHEPINPPTGLVVTASGSNAVLTWTNGADQYIGYIGGTPALVSGSCDIDIERRVDGGTWSLLYTETTITTTTYVDGPLPSGFYEYRIRYRINPSVGFSAYSNIDSLTMSGGWGVGMVRMGTN